MNAKAKWYTGKHLYIVFITLFLFLFYNILSAGSTNTVIPALCAMNGWNEATVLFGITVAGYVGAVATLVLGTVAIRRGARAVCSTCLILCGIGFAAWGYVQSETLFIAAVIFMTAMAYGFQTACCPVITSTWFPRTKGIVLGWSTMGIVLVDVVWSPFAPGWIEKYGRGPVMLAVGALYVILGILVAATVHNYPEEEGRFPDNLKDGSEDVRAVAKELGEYKTPFTFAKCIRTKEIWQIIFGWALLIMIAVCFVSRFVPRVISLGYAPNYATTILAVCAVSALVGSWLFGVLDQKLGTKKASVIYAVWGLLMWIMCLLMPMGPAFIWISAMGIMFGIGGIYNLIVSMAITKFGRWDFIGANRFIGFGQAILVSSSFALNALFMNSSLGYTGLYVCCLIINIICLIIILKTNSEMIGKKD